MNCQFCSDTPGWEITERDAVRCRHTKAKPAESFTPITPGSVSQAVKALGAIAFFPQDQMAQTMIGDALASMCGSVEALRYVVRRAVALYRTWDRCGVPGLRQIVCAGYRPADGIESGPTDSYPDGLPSETKYDPLALPEGARKLLPAGHTVTVDVELEKSIQELAEKCKMPPAHPLVDQFAHMLREIMTAPSDRRAPEASKPVNLNFKPIDETDVARAVQENRAREARKLAGEWVLDQGVTKSKEPVQ